MIEWTVIQNREDILIEQLDLIKVNFRFYTDIESGKLRWTSLNIYELDRVLELLDIEKILLDEYDRRLSTIDKLQMNQLKDECVKRNIPSDGKKVMFSEFFYMTRQLRHCRR